MSGWAARIEARSAPRLPPTSTSLWIPEKSYAARTAASTCRLRLVIASSKMAAALGLLRKYSNNGIP
jgi:hypothetical protein